MKESVDPPSPPLLGEFIRTHRERLAPAQVGLPPGFRRRAKGLRREELASLCGISPTWLTWIEQGRARSLSAATLARLAEALQLTGAERAYLFDLAALRDPEASSANAAWPAQVETLQSALREIKSPAYVLDRYWRAQAWNRPAEALFTGWLGRSATERNLLRYTFLDPEARHFIVDWDERARRLVAEFRADLSASLQEAQVREQVDGLRTASVEFDRMWDRQDVQEREGGERNFDHPVRGRLSYRQLTLRVAQAPQTKLVMLL